MYKKTFKYVDFLGNEREEEHYFHLSEAEVMKWLTMDGDYTLDKLLSRLAEESNGEKIIDIFESLILRSYGRVSLDGRRFEKSEELAKEFKETPAYSQLFTELMKSGDNAANFIKAVIPKDMDKKLEEFLKTNDINDPKIPKDLQGSKFIPGA